MKKIYEDPEIAVIAADPNFEMLMNALKSTTKEQFDRFMDFLDAEIEARENDTSSN